MSHQFLQELWANRHRVRWCTQIRHRSHKINVIPRDFFRTNVRLIAHWYVHSSVGERKRIRWKAGGSFRYTIRICTHTQTPEWNRGGMRQRQRVRERERKRRSCFICWDNITIHFCHIRCRRSFIVVWPRRSPVARRWRSGAFGATDRFPLFLAKTILDPFQDPWARVIHYVYVCII